MVVTGYLIAERAPVHHGEYAGPGGGVSWPLSALSDPAARALSEQVSDSYPDDWPTRGPWLISDERLARAYLACCRRLGLEVSAYFVEWNFDTETSTRCAPAGSTLLGVDVTAPGLDASLIQDELLGSQNEALRRHKSRLNSFGLFDDPAEAVEYLELRKDESFLSAGWERVSDYAPARMSLLQW